MAKYQFTRSAYKEAISDYDNNWQLIDEVLRKLCQDHPSHGNRAAVNAKVQIIGLAYGTGIQRSITALGNGPGGAIYQVAEYLFDEHDTVDELIGMTCTISEPLTLQGLLTIVSAHGRFVELLGHITRNSQAARTFVSKYLHFHRPVVPIYDGYTATILPALMPKRQVKKAFTVPEHEPEHADSDYYWHTLRFLALYSAVRSACLPVSVKYVDAYLLWLASHPD